MSWYVDLIGGSPGGGSLSGPKHAPSCPGRLGGGGGGGRANTIRLTVARRDAQMHTDKHTDKHTAAHTAVIRAAKGGWPVTTIRQPC